MAVIRPASLAIKADFSMNMAVLKRMMSAVLLSGLLAGVVLTAIQQIQVSPIILQAEVYEDAAAAAKTAAPVEHEHGAAAEHEHEHGWEPGNGLERKSWTVVANVIFAVGFGLILSAAILVSGKTADWRTGLLWGVAGYLVFFVAPSLGLHPEVPGTQAAPLHDRQLWWLMTSVMTAGGLACLVFVKNRIAKIAGLILLVIPHAIGAPHLAVEASAAPEKLAHAFIVATSITNAIFWLMLGGLNGFFYRKFG
jgi:cobalt transporter subunit CbtA